MKANRFFLVLIEVTENYGQQLDDIELMGADIASCCLATDLSMIGFVKDATVWPSLTDDPNKVWKTAGFKIIDPADPDDSCGHDDCEDCLICASCGRCREDLDSNDICMDCGGVDENEFEEFSK